MIVMVKERDGQNVVNHKMIRILGQILHKNLFLSLEFR